MIQKVEPMQTNARYDVLIQQANLPVSNYFFKGKFKVQQIISTPDFQSYYILIAGL